MRKILLVLFAALLIPASASALTILDFDTVPTQYWFPVGSGGGVNLGNYYPGVTFGSHAIVLDTSMGQAVYNYDKFPPHSVTAVLFADSSSTIEADFANPVNHAEVWYSSDGDFGLSAYNASGGLIASASGLANLYSTSRLEVNSGASDIAYVTMTGPAPGHFTIDDFGYNAVPLHGALLLFG